MRVDVIGQGVIGTAIADDLAKRDCIVWHIDSREPREYKGDPDALVCAYGDFGPLGEFRAVSIDSWRAFFEANFFAQLEDVQQFAAKRDGRPGRVIVLSGAGVGGAEHPKLRAPYVTAKAALVQFVEVVSLEFPNIAINAVAPGSVKSKMNPDGTGTPDKCAQLVGWLMKTPQHITGRLLSAQRDTWPYIIRSDDDYRLRRYQ